ncbi:MAG TPA: CoB--CoM heterodisulfide reductase iron-sulfur subunit B family protein [Myxococcota bacterium]|jgi:heterodisulfide reductase subunit B|nr:CoB--CoM heterodisulfide reductase iron-sulfur subunit B family protein [Myxococcota bacterium]HON25091.1 CoB--CoM heterodisulfide reductase iron-sulfur subunit B family protein [Myxococcota bacterium]HOS62094.1 CoB--CoM heterodisulfide reductase iron-sulfur subunit B family protein [Myxococcota bacterium]HPC91003.1 CoB--CoM heterodisulfide reductase iron-sulfur subunit B family protein [Myxococcota bacterium]HPL25234.1 CoB--CoM heterodisulfide reductase iron-sulfur subunit B family protein 
MNYAIFLGCKIPAMVPAYEDSTRAVLGKLKVGLQDLPFTCCGYPTRSLDLDASVVAAAHNLALAKQAGLAILTPCKCCFGQLRHAQRFLEEYPELAERVSAFLQHEGLPFPNGVKVDHLLTVLSKEVGLENIRSHVTAPRTGLKVAAHYGCHALRPSAVTGFDNPMAPTIFEDLVAVTGATPVIWPRRIDCCGEPVSASNPDLSERIARGKITSALESGSELLVTACPYCHMRFEELAKDMGLPLMLYPQLLGQALGIPEKALGL